MAKLIKIDKSQAKRVTHKECGAVIEYFESECGAVIGYFEVELEYQVHSDYGGGSDRYAYLTCPNCKKRFSWCV